MDRTKFREEKIEGREILHKNILNTLKLLNPVAIHQFGSGVNGYRDEFSDMDIWVTFRESELGDIIQKRDEIYSQVAPVLIKSEAPQNAPLGGKYSLVIYDTDHGLYHVDYYLSAESNTNIRPEAIFHHGSDELPRGEWILDRNAITQESLEETMNQTITMAFILTKAIIRGGWNTTHADYLRSLYKDIQRIKGKDLRSLPESSDFTFLNALLDSLDSDANDQQRLALSKIKDYVGKVEILYR